MNFSCVTSPPTRPTILNPPAGSVWFVVAPLTITSIVLVCTLGCAFPGPLTRPAFCFERPRFASPPTLAIRVIRVGLGLRLPLRVLKPRCTCPLLFQVLAGRRLWPLGPLRALLFDVLQSWHLLFRRCIHLILVVVTVLSSKLLESLHIATFSDEGCLGQTCRSKHLRPHCQGDLFRARGKHKIVRLGNIPEDVHNNANHVPVFQTDHRLQVQRFAVLLAPHNHQVIHQRVENTHRLECVTVAKLCGHVRLE
mmetsp:Transcript_5029/g.13912  ORF Transcript_5029/g.13912 Transcript_5029/m.13912 type:complete len:252 (+) Transcript_5029:965-1720(+)